MVRINLCYYKNFYKMGTNTSSTRISSLSFITIMDRKKNHAGLSINEINQLMELID